MNAPRVAAQLLEADPDRLKRVKKLILAKPTLRELHEAGELEIYGSVERIDRHYAHKYTVRADISGWDYEPPNTEDEGMTTPEFIALRTRLEEQYDIEAQVATLEEEVNDYVREVSDAIYHELEAEWDSRQEDSYVDDLIAANEWKFSEDGDFLGHDEGLPFDELEDSAKETARDRVREMEAEDSNWHDFIIEDWQQRLENKGFNDPEIQYSGFWSQGDGASFTCKSIDWDKYWSGYDPLKPE
jgi:hypothetical protein